MTLEELGYNDKLESYRKAQNYESFGIGRVISEHKERYVVKSAENEYEGEILGNLRFTASQRSDFPAVGDWVAFQEYDEDKVLIHAIFPRSTIIERQAVGRQGEKQIIATNIDYGLIVQSVDRDFNINRIERYLTICNASKIIPIVILTKIDLINKAELDKLIDTIRDRLKNEDLIYISNETNEGFEKLTEIIKAGNTYCLLGSSGVGKSSLLNNLSGKELMKTGSISLSTQRGKHVTSYRELIVLESGGILIDNPGMREIGIADAGDGLDVTFAAIVELADACRYKDCTHTSESGCAILDALESGIIDNDSYQNYMKLEREKEHYEASAAERRKKDKDFGKMVKTFKKIKKHNKD